MIIKRREYLKGNGTKIFIVLFERDSKKKKKSNVEFLYLLYFMIYFD